MDFVVGFQHGWGVTLRKTQGIELSSVDITYLTLLELLSKRFPITCPKYVVIKIFIP